MIMEDVHEGLGTHENGKSMAKNILRVRYYWFFMEDDCFSYVKRCHKSQIYADNIHIPQISLNVLTSLWPISIWKIDEIRPI